MVHELKTSIRVTWRVCYNKILVVTPRIYQFGRSGLGPENFHS